MALMEFDVRTVGAIAGALAKAQAAFPTIPRDRTVKVKMKTGGEYTFKYAPLDTILAAVRSPLSANGLAVSQLLDGPDLVTVLLHESGETLQARIALPHTADVQGLGSVITYLRRYALQAMLGIAAEEDDDANAAMGNKATFSRREDRDAIADAAIAREGLVARPAASTAFDAGLVGIAQIGKGDADFELRQEATHGHKLAFRLTEGRKGFKVIALGVLAEMVAEYREGIEGQRVTCWGVMEDRSFTPKDSDRAVTYQELRLERLRVGTLDLAVPDVKPDAGESFEDGWLDKAGAA